MFVVYNPLWEQMTFVNHELYDSSFKLTFPLLEGVILNFRLCLVFHFVLARAC